MPKNKGGREVRKPKQAKKPKITTGSGPLATKIDATVKKPK
jgi:hypothetical protein